MRRLLVPFLIAPFLLAAAPATAGCDPETGECHAVDCLPWQPEQQARDAVAGLAAGDPNAALLLLPPACPA